MSEFPLHQCAEITMSAADLSRPLKGFAERFYTPWAAKVRQEISELKQEQSALKSDAEKTND